MPGGPSCWSWSTRSPISERLFPAMQRLCHSMPGILEESCFFSQSGKCVDRVMSRKDVDRIEPGAIVSPGI